MASIIPAAIAVLSAASASQTTVISNPPTVVSNPPTVVSNPPTVVSNPPTVVFNPTSTTVDQASVAFSSSTITITRTSGPLNFGVFDCVNNTVTTFTATFSSPVPTNSTLAIFLSDSVICATTAPSGTSKSVTDLDNTVTLLVPARAVVGAGTSCPVETVQKSVCVLATSSSAVSSAAFLTLTFNGESPDTPTLRSAEGGDGVAHLAYTATGVIDHVTIFFRQLNPGFGPDVNPCDLPPIAEFDAGLNGAAGAGAAAVDGGAADAGFDTSLFASVNSRSSFGDLVTGLVNGATYLFFVVSVDQFGNTSGQSNALTAVPLPVQDFYRRYRCEGGHERGGLGCTTASAAALAPGIGALVFALLRRRGARRP